MRWHRCWTPLRLRLSPLTPPENEENMSTNSEPSHVIRVLHSMRAPGGDTKYANHMAAVASDAVDVQFFTWPRAIFGRYEIFHLHWPEGLLSSGRGPRAWVTYALARLLLLRLRVTKTPVVYTLHNVVPHDAVMSRRLRHVLDGFARLTQIEIHLVPEPGRVTDAETVSIPHGSYHEPYAQHERSRRTPGRILFFGLIRKYKGVEELLAAYQDLDRPSASLRIVGKALEPTLKQKIAELADGDATISTKFAFVADRELVAEVTSSELVVLPYRELHSSGVALVALSLGRPVLVPDSTTGRALQEEVGSEWVHLFAPPLTADDLRRAHDRALTLDSGSLPDLSDRSWDKVRARHTAVYVATQESHQ